MEKKKIEISVSTLVLFILVVILIMAVVILGQKNNQYMERISELEESVIKLQLEDNQKNNVVVENEEVEDDVKSAENTLNQKDIKNSSNTAENETIQEENTLKETAKESNSAKENEIIGRWNTYRAIEITTATEITNLAEVFGSSIKYGSYLQLNEDGTFLDNISPVTDGSKSVKGTYIIQNNYKKLGDCYIVLNYDDGRTERLQRVYYDDSNVPSLSTEYNQGDIYQFDLKK